MSIFVSNLCLEPFVSLDPGDPEVGDEEGGDDMSHVVVGPTHLPPAVLPNGRIHRQIARI